MSMKRSIDDFAFVKEAGFVELYKRIEQALSIYDKDLIPLFCANCRLSLERALKEFYIIAGFKPGDIPQSPAKRISNLYIYFQDELFPVEYKDSFTELNQITNNYHHDDDFPEMSAWGKDAENCYRLMIDCFHYLDTFRTAFPKYIEKHVTIDYEERMIERLSSRSESPFFNSIDYTMSEDFDIQCLAEMYQEQRYSDSLEKDLNRLYKEIQEKTSQTYFDRVLGIPEEIYTKLDFDEKANDALIFLGNSRDFFSRLIATRQVYSYICVIHPILFDPNWKLEAFNSAPYSGGPTSLSLISKRLQGVNTFAVKRIIDLLDAHEKLREKAKTDVDTHDQASLLSALVALSKQCDISALRDLSNFSQFLRVRDRSILLNPHDKLFRVLSNEDKTLDNCRILILNREKRIIEIMNQVLPELLNAPNSELWNSLFPFEQKYITDIQKGYNNSALFTKSLKKEIAISDMQKHILALRQTIQDAPFLVYSQLDEAYEHTFDRAMFSIAIESAIQSGYLDKNDPNYFVDSYSVYSLYRKLRECGIQDVWEYVNKCGEEAVSKGLFTKEDPKYSIKNALLASFTIEDDYINNGLHLCPLDDAIQLFNEIDISDMTNNEFDWLSSPVYNYYLPLLNAIVFITDNNPMILSRIPAPWDSLLFPGNQDTQSLKASLRDIFRFVRRMSPIGLWRFISSINCPAYCEDQLLEFIHNNDYESFRSLVQKEEIEFSSTLSEAVSFILTHFDNQFKNVLSQNLEMIEIGEKPSIPLSINWSGYDYEHLLDKVLSDGLIGIIEPTANSEKKQTNYIMLAVISCSFLCFYDYIEDAEAEELNSILNRPCNDSINRISFCMYYVLSGRWPKTKDNPLSSDEQKLVIDFYNKMVNDNSLHSEKQYLNNDIQTHFNFIIPDDLFSRSVDTTHLYIPGLKRELKDISVFSRLFDFILKLGGITSDDEAGALLRAFTGYPVENANDKATWNGDYHILYYLVKNMFTAKKSYSAMKQCIDISYPSDDERRKAEKSPSSYAERIGGDDAPYIIETLHRLWAKFPELETPLTD